MEIIRDAIVLIPNQNEHNKLVAFLKANSAFRWAEGVELERRRYAAVDRAYEIDDGVLYTGDIKWYSKERVWYQKAIENHAFLISVDEYIARCIGWDDVESDSEIDLAGLL